ncbi:MAG: hypothetical protein BWY66_00557 [bacterium ADurb.Bin374]|nr:MAG: hypothetical protein BWY66_00557 [bacterium ADurb.Bin374]
MSEENKNRLAIDFGSPEATIVNIVKAGEDLVALLQQETEAQGLAKIELEKAESDVAMAIRNGGVKVTEGYVDSAVDGDTNVVGLRQKYERLSSRVAGIKASLENVDRAYGLFKTWMLGQRQIGLGE